ncbi:MAG: UDP-3-O-(3-hydroxymyristoyl)glucosamine N-acyltransferase [Lachnospiraceae bacterium]|nr:UDP-3-O-(3-hydroxymyristoyl)glucosamine N-acyltransferase [Lachnospiraceae bacterium]
MEFSASQIAALVSGKVEGDGNVTVSTFAKIEEGHPGAISFLANPKYTHYIYTTKSSIVLVSNDFVPEEPVQCTMIRVADPYATVAFLLDMVSKMTAATPVGIEQPAYIADGVAIADDCYVGAFAYIGKGTVIGKNVKIYPQTYVGNGVVIGDNTIIYPGVKIYHGCKIGKNCILHSGVVIGADGFGFAPVNGEYNKIPQLGIVELEDDVEIGANTTIDRAMMGATKIHHGVKLDNLIQIAHNCEIGANTVMAAQAGVAGSAKIGAGCMVGGQVGFAGHIHVGDGSVIGAQSGIPNDVKPGSRLMGYPAVGAGEFARQAVYNKNLGKLFDRVKDIEKKLNK